MVAASDLGLADRVAQARANGRTWTQIGAVLGVSRQAARERFGESAHRWTIELRDRSCPPHHGRDVMAEEDREIVEQDRSRSSSGRRSARRSTCRRIPAS